MLRLVTFPPRSPARTAEHDGVLQMMAELRAQRAEAEAVRVNIVEQQPRPHGSPATSRKTPPAVAKDSPFPPSSNLQSSRKSATMTELRPSCGSKGRGARVCHTRTTRTRLAHLPGDTALAAHAKGHALEDERHRGAVARAVIAELDGAARARTGQAPSASSGREGLLFDRVAAGRDALHAVHGLLHVGEGAHAAGRGEGGARVCVRVATAGGRTQAVSQVVCEPRHGHGEADEKPARLAALPCSPRVVLTVHGEHRRGEREAALPSVSRRTESQQVAALERVPFEVLRATLASFSWAKRTWPRGGGGKASRRAGGAGEPTLEAVAHPPPP